MAKFWSKNKKGSLYVDAWLPLGVTLNEREMELLAHRNPRGLLSVRKKWNGTLEYKGPMGISLTERLKSPITRADFLFIMAQIVKMSEKLQSNGLLLNKLVLDLRYVYINETTKEVQFIYLPIEGNHVLVDMMAFLESIVYAVRPVPEKDMDYISRFIFALKSLRGYDPAAIKRFLSKEDRELVKRVDKVYSGQSGYITDKQRDYYDHYDGKDTGDDEDDRTQLLEEDDSEGTIVLDEEDDEGTSILQEDDDEGTSILNEDDDDDDTCLLGDDDDDEGTSILREEDDDGEDDTCLLGGDDDDEEGTTLLVTPEIGGQTPNPRYPAMVRLLTNEVISINKPVFRVGKERSYVDFFVSNNNAISRSHVDIITRGGRYYLKDLNSKNGSYVNGKQVPAQWEVEVFDGDRIRLANEEFIFQR